MKIKNLWMVTLFLIALFIPHHALLQAEAQINNITLQREGNYTNVAIFAETPFQFNHFIEEKKNGKPYRIVIDCMDAVHSLPQNNFRGLPSEMISAIRTSQYQVSPTKICRVVLDLKEPVVYKVVGEENSKIAKLALSTPNESAYPLWSAVQKEQKRETKEPVTLTEASTVEKKVEANKTKKELAVSTKKEIAKTDVKTVQKVEKSEKPVPQVKKEVAKSPVVKEKKQIELAQKPVESATPKKEVKTEEKAKLQTEKKKPEAIPAPEPVKAKEKEKKKEAVKITGKQMEEVPKRKILVYHSGKRKDPFSPLTGKKSFSLGSVPLPSINELKLVGVLEDNNGFKALLENELGFGYIMKPGDKIINGVVVSIAKERIIFQIWEYGFSKNIALELFKPNQEER